MFHIRPRLEQTSSLPEQTFQDTSNVNLYTRRKRISLICSIVDRKFKPWLIGEDPLDIERLWRKMLMTTVYWDQKGQGVAAASGVGRAVAIRTTAADAAIPVIPKGSAPRARTIP